MFFNDLELIQNLVDKSVCSLKVMATRFCIINERGANIKFNGTVAGGHGGPWGAMGGGGGRH